MRPVYASGLRPPFQYDVSGANLGKASRAPRASSGVSASAAYAKTPESSPREGPVAAPLGDPRLAAAVELLRREAAPTDGQPQELEREVDPDPARGPGLRRPREQPRSDGPRLLRVPCLEERLDQAGSDTPGRSGAGSGSGSVGLGGGRRSCSDRASLDHAPGCVPAVHRRKIRDLPLLDRAE